MSPIDSFNKKENHGKIRFAQEGAPASEAVDAIILYFQNNYKDRSAQGRTVALMALREKYPFQRCN